MWLRFCIGAGSSSTLRRNRSPGEIRASIVPRLEPETRASRRGGVSNIDEERASGRDEASSLSRGGGKLWKRRNRETESSFFLLVK